MGSKTQIDTLDKNTILDCLGSSMFAANIILHDSMESTNRLAKELARQGAPEGTVVLAEEQTGGRGRMKRKWMSPGFKNLLVSILLRPPMPVDQLFVLTMILSIAVADEVSRVRDLNVMVKWPNDLYVGPKKLGGILTEFAVTDKEVQYVVLGLGLNVNWNPGEQEGLLYPATSIMAETGITVSRNELLAEILKRLEGFYREVIFGKIDDLYRRWNELSLVIGREVEILSQEEILQGTALRIDRRGALVIRDCSGKERKILSGDVSLRL